MIPPPPRKCFQFFQLVGPSQPGNSPVHWHLEPWLGFSTDTRTRDILIDPVPHWTRIMENHAVQKRQSALSNTNTGLEAGNRIKRVQGPSTQPASSVGHATATGSARMLNGNVLGDNIHGNVCTTINNFHAGTYEPSEMAGPITAQDSLLC